MPRVQNSYDFPVLNDFLVCYKKRNNPRIHHAVCENRCKQYKKCSHYRDWYERVHGEDFDVEKIVKPKKRITKPKKRRVKK